MRQIYIREWDPTKVIQMKIRMRQKADLSEFRCVQSQDVGGKQEHMKIRDNYFGALPRSLN